MNSKWTDTLFKQQFHSADDIRLTYFNQKIVHPQTIQIYLPGGDPRGIRVAEITTRIVQVIQVPRNLLKDFLQMSESSQVALYFLFGEADDGIGQRVYIGQTGDLRTRLATHHREKDFWEQALVLVSKTNSLTTNHALFLEWHCIQTAEKTGRYDLENGNNGIKPHTPAPLEAECLEIFETGQVLLSTLGYPVFTAVIRPAVQPSNCPHSAPLPAGDTESSEAESHELFLCQSDHVNGKGYYTPEGFVVLKGSIGRRANLPALAGHCYERLRADLFASGVIEPQGDSVIFTRDHLFRKPSPAAVALLGRPANGWNEWVSSQNNKTLNELKRQSPL